MHTCFYVSPILSCYRALKCAVRENWPSQWAISSLAQLAQLAVQLAILLATTYLP